jgi:hypothetical protein
MLSKAEREQKRLTEEKVPFASIHIQVVLSCVCIIAYIVVSHLWRSGICFVLPRIEEDQCSSRGSLLRPGQRHWKGSGDFSIPISSL